MKNVAKRMLCMLSALCMALGVLLASGVEASAATAAKKAHIGVTSQYSNAITVTFEEGDYKIANLKTPSDLIARVTYVRSSSNENTYDENYPWGYAEISLYAKKAGTYKKVTFDVVDRTGEVTSSHTVKVKADTSYAIKSASFAGSTKVYGLTTKKKGAFKVKMNSGYTLKGITMTTYNKSGEAVTKKISNGDTVTLGKYRSKNVYEDTSTREQWNASLFAPTYFEISYTDSYTGETKTATYYLYRVPSN